MAANQIKATLATAASALALAFAVSTPTIAQDLDLGEIVVTPNRMATELSKTGSTVTRIDRQEIEDQSQPLVVDYLAQVPGITLSSTGGPGAEGSLSLRGAPRRYVKTLYNGIDISDPTSTQVQTSYQYLLSGGIDSIEVLKGSQSTLYGSDAIAGVISISTLGDIEPGISHLVSGEGGSRGTARGSYGLRAAKGNGRLTFNLLGFHTDGISAAAAGSERDSYDNISADIGGEYRFSENFAVFASGLYIDAEAEFDDAFADPLQDDPFHTNINRNRQIAGRMGFDLDLMDGRLKNTFAVQGFSLDRSLHSDSTFGPYNANYEGKRLKAEYQGSFEATEWLTLQYGADHEGQTASFTDDAGSLPIDDSVDMTGVWAQGSLDPIENLTLSLGLRHDEHSSFGGETTYRMAGAYLFADTGTRLHASAGTGFRAPSLYELFAPPLYMGGAPVGNPDLKPETSTSFDIGIEQRFLDERLVADLTYFQIEIDNLIDCVETAPFECRYAQVPGTTQMRGVEASFAYAATSWLDLGASYTYTQSEAPDGSRSARVPRHTIVLTADYRPAERWKISASGLAVLDTVDTGNYELDDYFLLNAKLAYKPTENTELYLRGENLLDQDYQTARGYGTPGISVFAGFKARFGP